MQDVKYLVDTDTNGFIEFQIDIVCAMHSTKTYMRATSIYRFFARKKLFDNERMAVFF